MKKLFTFLLTIVIISAYAQTEEGFHPDPSPTENAGLPYACDCITSGKPLENIHWWKQVKKARTGLPEEDSVVIVRSDSSLNNVFCLHREKELDYNWTRDSLAGSLKYFMKVPYGVYDTIGVSFGEENYLDISQGNANINFSFNNTSDSALTVSVGLRDRYGKLLTHLGKNSTLPENYFTEETAFQFPAKTQVRREVTFVETATLKPYSLIRTKDTCSRTISYTKDFSFDFTKLESVFFIITTHKRNANDDRKPYKFEGTFGIGRFTAGGARIEFGGSDLCRGPIAGLAAQNKTSIQLQVYPNPVTGNIINLGTTATDIRITDLIGNLLITIPSASQIDVSSLHKGMYSIVSRQVSGSFVIK